jgi:hypothetical protein
MLVAVTLFHPVSHSPPLLVLILPQLYGAGLLKHWIQQNHDSLPQKAGFPQHALNEIHGSLHDPANPIVPYEGTLRDDLYKQMKAWAKRADLCLAMGTSMSGFNADNVPFSVATRHAHGHGLGLVIINLQQTSFDAHSTLRIFAKLDDVMALLAIELGLEPLNNVYTPHLPDGALVGPDQFRIPFDDQGHPSDTTTVWDLRIGSWVRLTGGPYAGDVGQVMDKHPTDGHYCLRFEHSVNPTFGVLRRPFNLWLGSWWIEQATYGRGITGPDSVIPIVNCAPPTVDAALKPVCDLAKYRRMLQVGLNETAVRQKMACDGIDLAAMDDFFSNL